MTPVRMREKDERRVRPPDLILDWRLIYRELSLDEGLLFTENQTLKQRAAFFLSPMERRTKVREPGHHRCFGQQISPICVKKGFKERRGVPDLTYRDLLLSGSKTDYSNPEIRVAAIDHMTKPIPISKAAHARGLLNTGAKYLAP